MIFLKNMFEETNINAEPNADMRPMKLEAEKSEEHAIITPKVKGSREIYVLNEYRTRKSNA